MAPNRRIAQTNAAVIDNANQAQVSTKLLDTNMIPLLPVFEGADAQSFDFFVEQFRQIADLTSWTSVQKAVILKTRLRDRAKEYLSNNTKLQKEPQFEKVINILSDKFRPLKSVIQTQAKFQSILYTPDKDLDQLAAEITEAAHNMLGISDHASQDNLKIADHVKFGKFLELIPCEIKTQLQTESVDNFSQAVKRAKELQYIYDESAQVSNAIKVEAESSQNQIIHKLQEEIQQLKNELNNVKNRNTKVCRYCNKKGHEQHQCFFRKTKQNKNRDSNFKRTDRNEGQRTRRAWNNRGRNTYFRQQNNNDTFRWTRSNNNHENNNQNPLN